ncbi:putative peroxidase [Helianthus anomalus]
MYAYIRCWNGRFKHTKHQVKEPTKGNMMKTILVVLVASILVVGCLGGNGKGHGHRHSHGHGRGHGHGLGGGLQVQYYQNRCGSMGWVEKTVKDIVWRKVAADPTLAAKLLRLHYHDCFVRGCDASILLDPTQNNTATEKTAGPNRSISGYEVIDEIKTKLEATCPKTVSCADILALAARDAVSFQFKREMWPVFTGRKDGRDSLASEVSGNLPSANANFTTLLTQFGNKKLNLNDLVTLSGIHTTMYTWAHTIGFSRCALVSRRLYNFTGKGDADPSLDPAYAQTLRKLCPTPVNPSTRLEMDPKSSLTFDSDYYRALNKHKGLFVSDAALLTNRQSASVAQVLENPAIFFAQFARSMVKMGAVEVLTGGQGEVRKNCRVVNGK